MVSCFGSDAISVVTTRLRNVIVIGQTFSILFVKIGRVGQNLLTLLDLVERFIYI